MNWSEHLPALVIAIPLLGAFAAPLVSLGGKTLRNLLLIVVSFVTLVIAFLLWRSVLAHGVILYVMGGESFSLTLPSGFTFPVRILFEIDALSAFMGMTVGIASFAGALFSLQYMRGFSGLHRFVSLYFLLTVGAMGMSLTGDMFNFFVFIEIASVASFGLIAFWRDKPEAIEASFKYMLLSQISAMLILIAVGSIYGKYNFLNMAAIANAVQMSTLDKLILALLVAALAMKCGAFPMSMWMPDSYAESPSGVTCLLVTVSQVSLYGLMRVCFTLFGTVAQSGFIPWIFIVLGLMSMFFGVTMAVIQHEIKRLIGYHSISQVGYMLLAFGVGLAALHDPRALSDYGFTAIKGGLFHMVNYSMYKGLLFLAAGALYYATGTRDLNEMGGLARRMPYTTVLFLIAAAAISGIPPFNGFVSKLLIYESVFTVHPMLSAVALVTSVLTLASFVKIFQAAFLGPEKNKWRSVREVPASMVLGMMVFGVVIIGFSLFPSWTLSSLVEPAAKALIDQAGYISAVLHP